MVAVGGESVYGVCVFYDGDGGAAAACGDNGYAYGNGVHRQSSLGN